MRITIDKEVPAFQGYAAERTRGLFNVDEEKGRRFRADWELPIDGPAWSSLPEQPGGDWQLGLVIGPSGSGKSSLGEALVAKHGFSWLSHRWPKAKPLVEALPGSFDEVTGALAQVGLGDVPAWLRPYSVLSNGERFRADLTKLILQRPEKVVVDEFTSVVDRQVARVGAGAFGKAWRKGPGQAVLLTCHYDVAEWLQPDWTFHTETGEFAVVRGRLQRPEISLEVVETGWDFWPYFVPHHYLDLGPMPYATAYTGFVDGEPICHLGMSAMVSGKRREARACRMVVLPEWQGAGVGTKFLDACCERELQGKGFVGKPTTTVFHTNHPGLCFVLRRSKRWRQVSTHLYGASRAGISDEERRKSWGWGRHFRAVQGFRYYGEAGVKAAERSER